MTAHAVEVRQATVEDLDLVVPLFDAYRQFYRRPSEPERARSFLLERFEHSQSVIFLSFEGTAAIGFTQLYPSFSSGAMAGIFIPGPAVLFVVIRSPREIRCSTVPGRRRARSQQ